MKHLIWSALEDPRKDVMHLLPQLGAGRVVPHFESKAEIAVSPVLVVQISFLKD